MLVVLVKNALLLSLLLAGCGNGKSNSQPEELLGASGVSIIGVSLYQGPEIPLADGGGALETALPIIAGRDALIRVFYDTFREGDTLTGVLEFSNGERFEQYVTLVDTSKEWDLDSTLNFQVPGDLIADSLEYKVSIAELSVEDNPAARHPDQGFETRPVEPPTPFKVTLVPYRYNADGSGRLPSTSPQTITAFEERFQQLFPISNVELDVHAPVVWSGAIEPNGAGWQDVIMSLYQLRAREGAADDEYYYAMFNPTSSVANFCRGGCILGLTLLNNSPEDVGDSNLRIGLGVGFPFTAADTMLHELGHAHGRSHAPCGPGVNPNSIDENYPHSDGLINDIAYDVVEDELVPSSHADIMSYCDPQWISGYNYNALYTRMDNIRVDSQSRTMSRTTSRPSTVVFVNGDGTARWAESNIAMPQNVGTPVDIQVVTAAGVELVQGEMIRYDHLPGGLLVLPAVDTDVTQVAVQVDGLRYVASP